MNSKIRVLFLIKVRIDSRKQVASSAISTCYVLGTMLASKDNTMNRVHNLARDRHLGK